MYGEEGFMHSMADHLAALERIAAFSARLRGHELGNWRTREGTGQASCVRCGRKLEVYWSPFQPDMDGPALDDRCGNGAVMRAA